MSGSAANWRPARPFRMRAFFFFGIPVRASFYWMGQFDAELLDEPARIPH
jgi:hypothetical protein